MGTGYTGKVSFSVNNGVLELSEVSIHDLKRMEVDKGGRSLSIDSKSGLYLTVFFDNREELVGTIRKLADQVDQQEVRNADKVIGEFHAVDAYLEAKG